MSKKMITLPHHVSDYECMWNGIEDIYQLKSGEKIPDYFFFALAGFGNFVYINRKIRKGDTYDRMVHAAWNDGRTKKMYERLASIIGFQFKHIEGRTFGYTMKKAKEQIDQGRPVVLGALDMYYLPYYPKFYERRHIPIHYVLMVGYDEEAGCVYVQDCGLEGEQVLSMDILEKALAIEKTDLCDKNAICILTFDEQLKNVGDIAIDAFTQKAKSQLNPPVKFLGIPGMRKLAKEFPRLQYELTEEQYNQMITNILMFTGTVPSLPNAVYGSEEKDFVRHMAAREELAGVLRTIGRGYVIKGYEKAADYFIESGLYIQEMSDLLTAYLLQEKAACDSLGERVSELIYKIADIEEKAYMFILKGKEIAMNYMGKKCVEPFNIRKGGVGGIVD